MMQKMETETNYDISKMNQPWANNFFKSTIIMFVEVHMDKENGEINGKLECLEG